MHDLLVQFLFVQACLCSSGHSSDAVTCSTHAVMRPASTANDAVFRGHLGSLFLITAPVAPSRHAPEGRGSVKEVFWFMSLTCSWTFEMPCDKL